MSLTSIVLLALLAQEVDGADNAEAKARAQTLLREGAQHYERAEFADALEKFERAYAVFPSPKLLFNIGQASREVGRPVEAMDAFERFLAQAADAPAEMTAEAKRSMTELGEKVGKLLIECPVPGAEIAVDGKKVGEAPIQNLVRVAPGRHQVTATHAGSTPAIESVLVAAATVQTVVIRPRSLAEVVAAVRVPEPPPPPPVVVETVPAPQPVAPSGWWLGRKWTWIAGGSAVLLAGGATVAGLSMRSKFDELDKKCGSSAGVNYTGCSGSDIDALDLRKNTANVLWGLSAAAAVATGVLFYVEGRTVTVAPVAGGISGLSVSASY
jgi:hypothetical protein